MYPSDYGYATSGGTTKDRAACLAKKFIIGLHQILVIVKEMIIYIIIAGWLMVIGR